jgi:hypothetical protein
MWKLLGVLFVLLVGLAVLGYYQEWYSFGKAKTSEPGKTEFHLNVDQDKIKSDVEKAKGRVSPSKHSEDGK